MVLHGLDNQNKTTELPIAVTTEKDKQNMKTYIEKPELVAKNISIPGARSKIQRKANRALRHETHRMLTTGGWEEDDQYQHESFSPDIIGERMEKNPAFGFQIGGLL